MSIWIHHFPVISVFISSNFDYRDEGNAEEPESGSKAKKSKLKNAGVSNDTKVTDSEPKQKSEKKSKNKYVLVSNDFQVV